MLGKWCCRLLVDIDSLWYRVLLARYGRVHGRLEDGGRSCSMWWKAIGKILEGGGGGEGVSFSSWL